MKARWAKGVLSLFLPAFLSCCANVKAYERAHLAQPEMIFDADPSVSKLSQHLYNSKEAATGGYSAGGGGCGCN